MSCVCVCVCVCVCACVCVYCDQNKKIISFGDDSDEDDAKVIIDKYAEVVKNEKQNKKYDEEENQENDNSAPEVIHHKTSKDIELLKLRHEDTTTQLQPEGKRNKRRDKRLLHELVGDSALLDSSVLDALAAAAAAESTTYKSDGDFKRSKRTNDVKTVVDPRQANSKRM